MQESAIAVSTIGKWLVILTFVACMWELARNLWSNWGTSNFWTSSFAAALVGMLTWWVIGAIAYLSTPKKTEGNTPTVRQSAGASSIQQSASASGNTTITQVGGDLNVTQGGLSVDDHEMIKSLVKK